MSVPSMVVMLLLLLLPRAEALKRQCADQPLRPRRAAATKQSAIAMIESGGSNPLRVTLAEDDEEKQKEDRGERCSIGPERGCE